MERSEVLDLVTATLRDILQAEFEEDTVLPDNLGEDTCLVGRGAILNSLRLVSLLLDVEQRLEEERDLSITIANECAMSMQRSPFRTVGSLTDYVCLLVDERRDE